MTYKFTSVIKHEDGFGRTEDIFVVSDTYVGLSDLATATEVPNDLVDWDNTKHDLEAKSGEFVQDEISFTIDETRAKETLDWDVVAFILAAQDNSVKRFCARVINPAALNPVPEGDFEFRGRIVSDMSGEDIDWSDVQYGSNINPLRVWDCTAAAFDAGYLIDKELATENEESPGLFELIDTAWQDANIKDWVAYFDYDQPFDYSRVAAWGKLVPLGTLLNKLLALASSDGVTMTFDSTMTPYRVAPARFRPWSSNADSLSNTVGEVKTRYVNYVHPTNGRIWPYEILDDLDPLNNDNYQLRAGGDGTQAGDILISSTMIFPSPEEKDISYRRFKSLREMLYEIASDLGMYVSWIYDSASAIRCKFVGRDSLVTNDVYLRDTTKASINIRSVERQGQKERYVGVGTKWTREGGYTVYNYDGYGFRPSSPTLDGLPGKGRLTAMTISPTVCLLQGRGKDIINSGELYSFSLIPHGLRFRKRVGGVLEMDNAFHDAFPEYNRAVAHSGMFVMCPRHANDFSIGIATGTLLPQPVARIIANVDGDDIAFDAISDFKNWLYGLDEGAYDNEYTITVPGLNQFKFAPTDVNATWKAATLAARLTLDGIEWVVLGVQRNRYDTELRVHTAQRYDRFAIANGNVPMNSILAKTAPAALSDIERPTIFKGARAGETIASGQAVAIDEDGNAVVAKAIAAHVGRVIGIATQDAFENDIFDVQTSGRIKVANWNDFDSVTRMFVITIPTPWPVPPNNWSGTAPTVAPTGILPAVIPIGTVDQDGFFNINIERGFVIGDPSGGV
jgi:hypothetical protein